jgi:hypothetical protein
MGKWQRSLTVDELESESDDSNVVVTHPSSTKRLSFGADKNRRKRDSNPDDVESGQRERRRPWLLSSPSSTAGAKREEVEEVIVVASVAPAWIKSTLGKGEDSTSSLPMKNVRLPGSSGAQPLSVSRTISDEIWMTNGVSTDISKSITKEFPLDFVDTEFILRPPRLDGWISRRALQKSDKGLLKAINSIEES